MLWPKTTLLKAAVLGTLASNALGMKLIFNAGDHGQQTLEIHENEKLVPFNVQVPSNSNLKVTETKDFELYLFKDEKDAEGFCADEKWRGGLVKALRFMDRSHFKALVQLGVLPPRYVVMSPKGRVPNALGVELYFDDTGTFEAEQILYPYDLRINKPYFRYYGGNDMKHLDVKGMEKLELYFFKSAEHALWFCNDGTLVDRQFRTWMYKDGEREKVFDDMRDWHIAVLSRKGWRENTNSHDETGWDSDPTLVSRKDRRDDHSGVSVRHALAMKLQFDDKHPLEIHKAFEPFSIERFKSSKTLTGAEEFCKPNPKWVFYGTWVGLGDKTDVADYEDYNQNHRCAYVIKATNGSPDKRSDVLVSRGMGVALYFEGKPTINIDLPLAPVNIKAFGASKTLEIVGMGDSDLYFFKREKDAEDFLDFDRKWGVTIDKDFVPVDIKEFGESKTWSIMGMWVGEYDLYFFKGKEAAQKFRKYRNWDGEARKWAPAHNDDGTTEKVFPDMKGWTHVALAPEEWGF
ncbi:Uu.00g102700.m01.CDS01 [Anthostomella pinea]|uniref:Uu.00g102700.m01.CDS01 n=1 Tax=Anthostomella pinea TaxID=933095 RepID=A0AAI8YFI7_9PEZI|nr:Uu.00g102700.m01.CDS01 [Anthostomella pinea]